MHYGDPLTGLRRVRIVVDAKGPDDAPPPRSTWKTNRTKLKRNQPKVEPKRMKMEPNMNSASALPF
jgi:hypothetical protein